MSLEWNSYTIGESCELITGFPFKSKYYLDEGLFKVVRGDNVKEGFIKWDDKKRCWNELNDKLKKVILKEEDIVIGMDGSKLGKNRATISKKDLPALLAQRVACVRAKEGFDQNYIKYVILSNYFKSYVDKVKTGTSIPHISLGQISEFTFEAPDYKKQKTISSILSTIDKKITVNQEINKNLDNLLMSIFNSWFINFEVYDKSNGMKFDETFGDVPRLWSVEMLEDYVDFVTGVEPGSKNYHEKPEINDIPFIRVGDLGSRINTVFIDKSLSKNKILSPDDITLSLDATVGIVKMGLNGAYSTGMRKLLIKNDDINKPFLYCLVKSKRIQRIIETFATGTTILHAGKSIKHMNFVLSDEQTMNQFGKIGNPILSIILANLKEINKLTKLRDTLLPKLMSGEIDVSKINCDLKIIIRKIYIKSSKLFLWRYLSENKNYIKNTKSNETLLKSRTIYKINKFLAKFTTRYRYYRQQ